MKRILAALDLSAHSDRAFTRAVQIARDHNAELILAHVAKQVGSGESLDGSIEQAEDRLKTIYPAPPDVRISAQVLAGDPANGIAKLVGDIEADLVVLGLHHEDAIKDLLIETVAHFTIQHCNAPVLLVKERTQGPYRRVLAATDFSQCALRALRAALNLAPGAEFHVLHVYETPFPHFIQFSKEELKQFRQERLSQIEKDIREELHDFMSRHVSNKIPSINSMIERNDVDAGIAKAIRKLRPDLLAMGLSGRGLASLVGSRTEAYLNSPPCDLLVTA
jgi:nucleotide-binding universal stress UspA family protein